MARGSFATEDGVRSLGLRNIVGWWEVFQSPPPASLAGLGDKIGNCHMTLTDLSNSTINGVFALTRGSLSSGRAQNSTNSPFTGLTTAFGITMVGQCTPDDSIVVYWDVYAGGSSNRYHGYDDATNFVFYSTAAVNLGASDNNPHVVYWEANAAGSKFYRDGYFIGNASLTATTVPASLTFMNIGNGGLGNTAGRFRVGEAIATLGVQAPSDIARAAHYLRRKWGMG